MLFLLLGYTFIFGLLGEVPQLPILGQTIRGLYFHVPMWFGMVTLFFFSFLYAIFFLRTKKTFWDRKAYAFAQVGMLYGILGLLTGMLWAKFTWGKYWSGDPKQNSAAVCLLIYSAYFLLRFSFTSHIQLQAKMNSVYSILAFFMSILLLFILPRLTDSLHPGNGGNPGFNVYDLDGSLRWIFYPAIIGWIWWGIIMANMIHRYLNLKHQLLYTYEN